MSADEPVDNVPKPQPYIVGEGKTELFIPDRDGRIVPSLDDPRVFKVNLDPLEEDDEPESEGGES